MSSQPPYPQQPPYGPGPQYVPVVMRPAPTSTLAVAALVFSVIGVFTCGLASTVAVILGHFAWFDTSRGTKGGHGMTVASLILGYLVLIPALGFLVLMAIGAIGGTGA